MKKSKGQETVPDVSFPTGAQAEADEEMEDHLGYLDYLERLKKEQEKTSSQSKEGEIKSKQSMPGKTKTSRPRPMPRGAKKAKPKK